MFALRKLLPQTSDYDFNVHVRGRRVMCAGPPAHQHVHLCARGYCEAFPSGLTCGTYPASALAARGPPPAPPQSPTHPHFHTPTHQQTTINTHTHTHTLRTPTYSTSALLPCPLSTVMWVGFAFAAVAAVAMMSMGSLYSWRRCHRDSARTERAPPDTAVAPAAAARGAVVRARATGGRTRFCLPLAAGQRHPDPGLCACCTAAEHAVRPWDGLPSASTLRSPSLLRQDKSHPPPHSLPYLYR